MKHKGKDKPWHCSVGHLVLVVAERIDDRVHFKISDSMDNYPSPSKRAVVTRIILNIV